MAETKFKGTLVHLAGDFPKKGGQNGWTVRRHGIPCVNPGIVDAFLRIFVHRKNTYGNSIAILAVFEAAGSEPSVAFNIKLIAPKFCVFKGSFKL